MTMHSYLFLFWTLFFIVFNLTCPPSLPHPLPPPTPSNNITLFGYSSITHNTISLTQPHSTCPSTNSSEVRVGAAFHSNPIPFLDHETKDCASFLSSFTFSITQLCSSTEGMSFLITSNVEDKGFMGLPQDSFFIIQFLPVRDDLSHIRLETNNIQSMGLTQLAYVPVYVELVSGRNVTAWVEYRDDLKVLRVWVGYSSENQPASPVLKYPLDLSEQYRELTYVGFNGRGSSSYTLKNWMFRTFNGPLPGEIPQTFWDGLDLFCCAELSITSAHGGKTGVVVGVSFMLVVLAAVIIWFVCVCARRRKVGERSGLSVELMTANNLEFDRRRVCEIGAVRLSETAMVYKKCLFSGEEVLLKWFQRANQWGNPFTTEFATMALRLRHKNLVQFYGWYSENGGIVLVYEFMPNGSLSKILHRSSNLAVVLSWKQRLNIVLGVASALECLHEDCKRQIIHREVKTSNIMLDAEFNAKLGDFGVAEVYDPSAMISEANIPAGTKGYLAPEYVLHGISTVKTDVYSFGVVLLEVATGRKAVEDNGTVIVDWVRRLWEMGKLIEAADSRLSGKFDKVQMQRMLSTGLACVHPNPANRPTVKEAARMLQGEAPLPGFHHDTEAIQSELDDVPLMSPQTKLAMISTANKRK